MNDTEALTEAERDIMLTRCGCGHTINDHGSLGHCWACLDDEREDCPHDFEDLLCERVASIVAARVSAARADALREAERAVVTSMPHNWTLRYDGTEDPIAAAYEEGQRDACHIIRSVGCEGCACIRDHDGDYGSAGHAGPCPSHTCADLRAAVADPEPPAPWCPECGPTCPLHGEPPNTCPSCALGQHRCTRDLAPCDCRECA